MRRQLVALFGEAERGEFHNPYLIRDLSDLIEQLGHPPSDSKGLPCAVQALLFEQDLLFFRVEEEGFSIRDYLIGLDYLKEEPLDMTALCLPGVGDATIIEASAPVCAQHRGLLLLTEADLYDYLTN